MFFDEEIKQLALRKRSTLRELPPIPASEWRPPVDFPNLTSAEVLSIDVETREDDWQHGPGWARGPRGHIVGFSVGARDRLGNLGAWYFPLRHEIQREYNLDPVNCFAWLRHAMADERPKIGANLVYDLGWLSEENVAVNGALYDVQFAEALIDESARVGLDELAVKYYGQGKEASNLYRWLADAYGGNPNGEQRSNIFRSPSTLAGTYAEADASLPIRIFDKQWSILRTQHLTELFTMECRLIRLLVRMRRTGVRIDVARCEELYNSLGTDIEVAEKALTDVAGLKINVNSALELAPLFDRVGIDYPRTAKGAPSFEKEFMRALKHPVADLVNKIRNLYKVRGTFVKNYLLDGHVNGRIHCQFHSLRGDSGGTITGRLASSHPNLQNIPVRTEEGKKVRRVFVPNSGHLKWLKIDYSQIEYRMLAHFAVGVSGDVLRQSYVDNPKTDYHDVVYNNVGPLLGYNLEDNALRIEKRRPIKNINFGLLYGQGQDELAYKAGLSKSAAVTFFKAYHQGSPYVKATMKAISDEVQLNGFITTILNRRCRFNLWEPSAWDRRGTALPYEQAILNYGSQIRRAYDYKGTNYKFQGSAADVIKNAMATAEIDGVFEVIGDPLIQVHDELDFSIADDSPRTNEALRHLYNIMENSTPCSVPIKVDSESGLTWGDIK